MADDPMGPRIPSWLPPVLYALATLLLFRGFVFSSDMLYGGDTLSLGYMAREFFASAVSEEGVFPRWNPLILGGTPFLESLIGGDALYPTSLLLFLTEPYRALGWKLVLHVFAAGLFMYGWTRVLGRSRGAALVAGLAYSVAPFLVTLVHPGHDGKLFVTALSPLLFMAMEWTFRRRGMLPFVAVALTVALVLFTTHFQLAYFLFGAAGVYYAVRTVLWWRAGSPLPPGGPGDAAAPAGTGGAAVGETPPAGASRAAGRFGLFLGAAVVGALAAAVQLAPAFQYVTEHSRRTATTVRATAEENLEYATSWNMHPEEVMSLVVPEFPGNNAGGAAWAERTYWGRNATRDNHQYAGLVVLLLAAVGFLGVAGRGAAGATGATGAGGRSRTTRESRGIRITLAAIGIVGLLYALGRHTPVWRIAYELLPGVRLFRAPDMVAFLFGFAAVTLSSFGVDRLLAMAGGAGEGGSRGGRSRRRKSGEGGEDPGGRVLMLLLGLTGAAFLGLTLAGSGVLFSLWNAVVWPDIDPRGLQLQEIQRPFIVRGFFVATLLSAATAGVAWAARRGWLQGLGVVALLALLVFVDGFRVSSPFIQTLDFDRFAAADPIASALVERREASEEPFRVADMTRAAQEVRLAMFDLELATGHHPNDLARYRELIGMEGSSAPRTLLDPNVHRLLNVRFVVVPGELQAGPPPVQQTQVGGRIHQSLYELPTLPRARLVGEAVVLPEEETVPAILSPSFDPARTAVVDRAPRVELAGPGVGGEVTWLERGINEQRLRVRADGAALLVVADNWFPAWRAEIDGEEVPLLRAYHTLRAVAVPAGEHEVRIHYDSPTIRAGLTVSVVTLAALLALGLFAFFRGRKPPARSDGGAEREGEADEPGGR